MLCVSTGAARTINAFLKGNASGLCLLLTARARLKGGEGVVGWRAGFAWRIRRGEF